MKKLLTVATAIMISAMYMSAQMMPDSTVQVCAYWAKGDHAEYQCKSHVTKELPDGNCRERQFHIGTEDIRRG